MTWFGLPFRYTSFEMHSFWVHHRLSSCVLPVQEEIGGERRGEGVPSGRLCLACWLGADSPVGGVFFSGQRQAAAALVLGRVAALYLERAVWRVVWVATAHIAQENRSSAHGSAVFE